MGSGSGVAQASLSTSAEPRPGCTCLACVKLSSLHMLRYRSCKALVCYWHDHTAEETQYSQGCHHSLAKRDCVFDCALQHQTHKQHGVNAEQQNGQTAAACCVTQKNSKLDPISTKACHQLPLLQSRCSSSIVDSAAQASHFVYCCRDVREMHHPHNHLCS